MGILTRRAFVKTAAAAAACLEAEGVRANPLGLPLGVQLYSVRDSLPKDYDGTLRRLHGMGFREVEAAGFFGHSAAEVKAAMAEAGVRCVSAHYPLAELKPNVDATLAYAKELGLETIVCAAPLMQNPERARGLSWNAMMEAVTMEDWRWNAAQLNEIGRQVKAAGMRLAYHNHFVEFHEHGGVRPYDELLRLTDPGLVDFEMDCGWVVVGGARPEEYLRRYPQRFTMLHVKEFNLTGWTPGSEPVSTEMGRGSIDYGPIFAAAKRTRVRHIFVEQEAFPDMPAMQALRADADWLKAYPA